MIKFLKKYKKEALAVFTVGLMIQFAASIGPKGGGNTRSDIVAGKINGKPFYASELDESRREWRALIQFVIVPIGYQGIPYVNLVFGADVAQTIDQKPEMFMLLRREARDAEVRANSDEIETILANYCPRLSAQGEDTIALTRAAVTDLALIEANFSRLASNLKVSAPLREKLLAKTKQAIQLNVVSLPSADYLGKAVSPTTQQAEEQFNKYANVAPPTTLDPQNPFGFGYRQPDRVKTQYITIDRSQAEKVVQQRLTPYDWDVKARIYYNQHKEEFPTTQPAPTTQTASASSQPNTAPAYRPYAEVADEAIRTVQREPTDKLMLEVQSKIMSTMSADWRTFSQQNSAAAAATANAYPSYGYLKNLVDSIQKQFGLTVYVSDYDRFQSYEDLKTLSGIGGMGTNNGFAETVMQRAKPYMDRPDKTPAALAQLMQPVVGPADDLLGNAYIYRIIDARPAEPVSSLDEIRSRVEDDLRRVAAYELAQTAAAPVIEAARAGGIRRAAMAIGKSVIETQPFSSDPESPKPPELGPGILLSPNGQKDFAEQAFDLLSVYNPSTNPNPVKMIKVPGDTKVFVVQLTNVAPTEDKDFYQKSLEATTTARRQMIAGLRKAWYDYDATVKRMAYAPQNSQKSSDD